MAAEVSSQDDSIARMVQLLMSPEEEKLCGAVSDV